MDKLTATEAFDKVWQFVMVGGKEQAPSKWVKPEARCVSKITCELAPSGDKRLTTRYVDVLLSPSDGLTYRVGNENALLLLASVIS